MAHTLRIPPAIRPATSSDEAEVSTVLSRAFHDDPVFSWITPDAQRRRQILPAFFAEFARAFIPLGRTYTTLGGAALWAPAGVDPVAEGDPVAFGERMAEIVGPDAERSAAITKVIDANHPHEPAAYLQFAGVEPGRQGQGIGSALMAPMLAACDRDGVPAYLVSTSNDNRRLYERHGFVVTRGLVVPGAPPMWAMWRDPVAS